MEEQFSSIGVMDLEELCDPNKYSFICSCCDEKLTLPSIGFWEAVQKHEHIEEIFCRSLNADIQLGTETYKYSSVQNAVKSLANNSFACGDEVPQIDVGKSILPHKSQSFDDEDVSSKLSNSIVFSEENSYSENYQNEQTESDSSDESYVDTLDKQFDENNVNSFRFKFVPSYDKLVQQKLYPERVMQTLKKFDKTNHFSILRIGPSRFTCLLCLCDLVTKNRRMGKNFLLDHITGNRHMRQAESIANISAVNNFHEVWLNKEPKIQAHQVYFRPDTGNKFWCILCHCLVDGRKVVTHLHKNQHRLLVLDSIEKKPDDFYLYELQIQLYGIRLLPDNPKNQPLGVNSPKATPVKSKREARHKPKNKEKSKNTPQPEQGDKEPLHNIINSVTNPSGKKLEEILPNRLKKHLGFFEKTGNTITCNVCQLRIHEIFDVTAHICTTNHLYLTQVPLEPYKYFCEVCNLQIRNEFLWLKHFLDTPMFHKKLPESRKQRVREYECTKCLTVIFGDELSVGRHLATKRNKKKTETKLSEALIKVFRTRSSIEAEAERLLSEANETLLCNGPTMECCRDVEESLVTVFEGCKAYPFGSRISGLCNQKSDLDMFLDIGDMYAGINNQDSLTQVQLVKKVHSVLHKIKDVFQNVYQIPTARTPIVKFHHKKANIDCDVSLRHGLSVENTKFLRFCFDLMPVSQSLILILKMWSHENKLSEHLTTYALAIMAIFFLQTKRYLLSVKQLRQLNQGKGLIIGGWETVNYLPIELVTKNVEPYSGSVIELLKEFFLYYSKFAYTVDVICPLFGNCIKKKDFDGLGKLLPPEMNSYVVQLRSKEPEHFRNLSPLCIQDPFDLSHNLTKALQDGTLKRFKMLCEMSYKLLENL